MDTLKGAWCIGCNWSRKRSVQERNCANGKDRQGTGSACRYHWADGRDAAGTDGLVVTKYTDQLQRLIKTANDSGKIVSGIRLNSQGGNLRVLHASGEVRNIGAEIEQGGEAEGDQNRHEDNHRFHVFFLMSLVR
jgi:hypothetical protein